MHNAPLNCTAVTLAVVLYLEILGGGASLKAITYRLTLRTFGGGPVRHLEILGGGQSGYSNFFLKTFTYRLKLVIFRGGPVKKITLYMLGPE